MLGEYGFQVVTNEIYKWCSVLIQEEVGFDTVLKPCIIYWVKSLRVKVA
jgi:hypothetical protein